MVNAFVNPAEYGRGVEIVTSRDLVAGDLLKFDLDDELNNRKIVAVDVWSGTELAFSPSQNRIVDLTALSSTTINLMDGSDEKLKDIPARCFRVADNRGIRFYLNDFVFNMQSSFVQINESGLVTAGQSYYFTFWYDKRGIKKSSRLPNERR